MDLLLLSGQKRAGLVMAASGTALALLDHEETLRDWWEAMPGYVDRAQYMLEQVQDVVENVAEKGESLRRVLSRRSPSIHRCSSAGRVKCPIAFGPLR